MLDVSGKHQAVQDRTTVIINKIKILVKESIIAYG